MAVTFRIGGRDLTAFLRLQHDQGFDPAGADYSEPQFAGSSAFRDGQSWAGDANSNREWNVPLILSASSEDALHQLISDVNAELSPGAQVEYRSSGATESSYFTLERGRLDVQYEYWVTSHNRVRATLRLWSEPFANTATSRVVASFAPGAGTPLATSSLVQFPATGILGDVDAAAQLEVRVGSRVASSGRFIAAGVHRSASYVARFVPSDGRLVAQSSSVATGASGAVASLMYAVPVSPTGASGVALTAYLTPPAGHTGRHRVFGVFRSGLDQPLTLWARDRFGAPLGPTTAASQTDQTKWALADLGEIHVPQRASGQEPVPTQFVELIAGGASGATILASPALRTQGLFLVPLGLAEGMLVTPGAGADVLYGDTFARLSGEDQALHAEPNADQGGVWSKIIGNLGRDPAVPAGVVNAGNFNGEVVRSASGWYTLASGAQHEDVHAECTFQLAGTLPSQAAGSPAMIELYAKARATLGVFARFLPGPSQTLQIGFDSGAGPTIVACAGIASTRASGIYLGQPHKLVLRVDGDLAAAQLGTTPQHIMFGAVPAFAGAGALRVHEPSAALAGTSALVVDDVVWRALGSAPDTAAREWFRFESYPEPRAVQGNASVFKYDRAADFRGRHPVIPAVGSPGASGPAQIVVVSGEVDDFLGNDVMDVSVVVRESFRYLR